MLLAYVVQNYLFVAFDKEVTQGRIRLMDKQKHFIKEHLFKQSSFEKMSIAEKDTIIFLEINFDGEKITKKIYV